MSSFLLAVYVSSILLAIGYVWTLAVFGAGLRGALRSAALESGEALWPSGGARKPGSDELSRPFVSVVIAARNEEANIETCLESLLDSTYPPNRFEIIVVDDQSTDGTRRVVETFSKQLESPVSVRVEDVPAGYSSPRGQASGYKKKALSHGIAVSCGQIVALTDADCRVPRDWLNLMVGTFGPDTGFVAGPVVFDYDDSAFSRSIALEFMGFAGIHAGSIYAGRPASCSGANIAFRREAYNAVGGYSGLEHLSSGDDEFLMLRIKSQTSWNVRYCARSEATVATIAPNTVKSFLQQRRRWASKVGYYEDPLINAVHIAVYLFVLSIPLILIAAIWDNTLWPLLFIIVFAKIGAERWLLSPATRLFDGRELLRYHIPAQPFQMAYVLWAGLAGMLGNFAWKSRMLER